MLMFVGIIISPMKVKAAQTDPTPPPVARQRADCAYPTYATDHLVCSNAELGALDEILAGMIADPPSRFDGSANPWLEEQEAWFKRRSLCAFDESHFACAREAYRTRIAELGALTSPSNGSKPLRCPLLPGVAQYESIGNGLMIIRDSRHKPLSLAWPEDHRGWRPFVTYRWDKSKLRITRQGDNATLTCR